jgi:16S rRNA (uracil1498-N3)-methyltransferase
LQLFFSKAIHNNQIELDADESRHLSVLRKQIGDTIEITDGDGNLYTCVLSSIGKKTAVATIVNCKLHTYPWQNICIVVSPTKNTDRMEWMVEKLTEIGVGEIGFVKTENSERKEIKLERLEKKAVAAIKQSLKMRLPVLHTIQNFSTFITNNKADVKLLAHCYQDEQRHSLNKLVGSNKKVVLLIGPEGDFSKQELSLAHQNGFQSVELGNSRLRTETAALVACTILNQILD